jgi:murein DD-endopeptidase
MRSSALILPMVLVALLGGSVIQVSTAGQQIGRAPVEVQIPRPPAPARALGRNHLVYEVHVTNLGSSAVSIERLELLNGGGAALAAWSGPEVATRIRIVGPADAAGAPTSVVPPGLRAIAYLWVSLAPGAAAPAAIAHRLTIATSAGDRDTIATAALPLPDATAPLAPPVRGGPWVALRGPSNVSGHRLSLVTLQGRARVPQRFAVDWALLGEDGLLFRGERTELRNWYGYDVPVQAAADGRVVLVRDGAPDRPPFSVAPAGAIDATEAPGNVIVIDIGHGRFATYAHLKAGSLRVVLGDRVVTGQALARIGNSGNTLGPHLHFQIADAAEPLGGEGLPFTLGSFELVGRIPSLPGLLASSAWTPHAAQPSRAVAEEMPLENMVVRFEK